MQLFFAITCIRNGINGKIWVNSADIKADDVEHLTVFILERALGFLSAPSGKDSLQCKVCSQAVVLQNPK